MSTPLARPEPSPAPRTSPADGSAPAHAPVDAPAHTPAHSSAQAPAQAPVPSSDPTLLRPHRRFGLLGHAPALDGLRGVAVLLVVAFHFGARQEVLGHRVLPGGWAGVDVFFALSGFLITALILDEQRVHGRLDWVGFYARRACRLLPALLLMLAVWVAVLLAFNSYGFLGSTPSGSGNPRVIDTSKALVDVVVAVFYLANWNIVDGGQEAPLGHLWSLSVEEQFYLVWPLVLVLLLGLGHRLRLSVLGGLIAVSAALPWQYWDGGAGSERIYFGTDTRAVGLLAGAFAALVWHRRHAANRTARYGAVRAWLGLVTVAVIAVTGKSSPAKFLVYLALLGLAVAQLVPYLAENRGVLSRAFRQRWLVWLGKRSYGLYLWHYVWATWAFGLPPLLAVGVGLAGALVCTELSWRLVEQPALRFGRRWARVPH